MNRHSLRGPLAGVVLAGLIAAAVLPLALSGCGEKIAIPEATGVWANLAYSVDDTFTVPGVRHLVSNWGSVFVLTGDELSKRTQDLEPDTTIVAITGDPRAMCVDESGRLILVWDQEQRQVLFFGTTHLTPLGVATLAEADSVTSMATASAGIDTIPGGRTYLYVTDSGAGLVRRYAMMGTSSDDFACTECLVPTGVLAWPEGEGVRSVHQPGGLARDGEGRMLVCEMDPERNWVTRFMSEPDTFDTVVLPPEGDRAYAGQAIIFGEPTCEPDPATADFVLGDAATCGERDWVGGPSSAEGEFDRPFCLAVDGAGKIFVADQNNSRVQIFDWQGALQGDFQVRDGGLPADLCLIDQRPEGEIHFAAFLYVLVEGSDLVTKLISSEHYLYENDELPPYEE